MSKTLQDQFIDAEQTFLASVIEGPAAVEAFHCSWSVLQATFEEAMKAESVDEETLVVAQQVSRRIEIIAGRILELHEKTNALVLSLQGDLDVLFTGLNIDGLSSGIQLMNFGHLVQ